MPPEIATKDGYESWSPAGWLDECEAEGREPTGLEASTVWHYANVGNVWEQTGHLWEYCPAYWARFYQGPEHTDAVEAIQLAAWIERGAPWVVAGWPPEPPPEPLRQLLALVMSAEHEIARIKRDARDDDGGDS